MDPKVVIAGDGSGDKLPFPIKYSQCRASQTASDNQIQLLAFAGGLATKPGGTVPTNRRVKGGLRADEARQPWMATHLGEEKLLFQTFATLRLRGRLRG